VTEVHDKYVRAVGACPLCGQQRTYIAPRFSGCEAKAVADHWYRLKSGLYVCPACRQTGGQPDGPAS